MIASSKETPDLVSVVICAYNNWPDVEMTISSALYQSYRSLEVIVVDNFSTDATPEEVQKRFGKRIQYIRQANRDCAGAYNTGFALAQGEFIQFVDGDDVLAPNKIEKQLDIFRANPQLDIVYGDVRTFQTAAGRANWTDLATVPHEDMLKALIAPEGIWLDTLGILSRRRALQRVGAWDENLYVEDADYWLRAAWAGCRFGHCAGSPMGFKRLRSGQKMANVSAMERGLDAVWGKAIGYITREPYRSMLVAKFADRRLRRALYKDHIDTREALVDLAAARALSPETIPPLMYVAVWIAVVLPGGSHLARMQWLSPLRRMLAHPLRYREAKTSKLGSDA